MQTLASRIRRARALSGISQNTLATSVGVQRSAVAQWERVGGSHPSMEHLITIAIVTKVNLEWLGTGRGAARCDIAPTALGGEEYAKDEVEAQCLRMLRALPWRVRESTVQILGLISNNFK